MSEQLTYLTGLMQVLLGVLCGGCIVWLCCRVKLKEIDACKNSLRMSYQADQNLIKLLHSRLAEQEKLYKAEITPPN